MTFTPYSKLSADEQAARKLLALAASVPVKQTSVSRILRNAALYLQGKEIHPDNKGEVARLWKRL